MTASIHEIVWHNPGRVLSPAKLRVLLSILQMTRRREKITVRSLTKRLGYASPSYPLLILRELRKLGLICYEEYSHGTIRPKCQLDFYLEHLGSEKKYPGEPAKNQLESNPVDFHQ